MSRDPLSIELRRKLGLVVVIGIGLIIVPIALAKGGAAPWLAFMGLGSAMVAVYVWANRKD